MIINHSITTHVPLDNPLQIAVLNLFVTLKSRFPNLVVGAITRESVKKALANGITAEQVNQKVCMTLQASTDSYLNRLSVISLLMLIRR